LFRRAALFGALVLLALVVSSCSAGRIEASWGSLSTANDSTEIVFAYYDRLVKIDPISGRPVQLLDSEGNVRLDDAGNPRTWVVTAPEVPAQTQFYTAPLVLNDDTMLVASYTGHLFEVEDRTARVNNGAGVATGGSVVGNPLIENDALFLPHSDRNIQALSMGEFDPDWTFQTEHGIYGQPLLIDGVLYVGSLDHNVYALDPDTGEQVWAANMSGAVTSTPAYANDALYVGSLGSKMFKLGLDGEILATLDAANWVWGTPAVSGDMVYFGDVAGNLYAARDTGSSFELVWGPVQVATNAIVATPLVAGDVLIVGSRDRHVYWVDRLTGEVLQTRETRGEVLGNMLLLEPSDALPLSQPIVVVSTMANEELVVAFSLENGERLWAYQR
jgi:outer membrane protein assembly factor BamB